MLLIFKILQQSLTISFFVFAMMVILDYFNVFTKGNINNIIKRRKGRQYLISSFLGSTPGCLGAFLNVSFYVHGLISFGALVGGMIATSGDEAFVMLSLFPKQALLLFVLLFIFGVILGWLSDKIAIALKLKTCEECKLYKVHSIKECKCFDKQTIIQNYFKLSPIRIFLLVGAIIVLIAVIFGMFGPSSWGWKRITFTVLFVISLGIIATVPEHFLREHIWEHIVKKHLLSVFLWSFSAMMIVEVGFKYWSIGDFAQQHMEWIGLIAVLMALIPESGPHMIFVMLYAQGIIPFSILLASSIVQDGHGMLPLLSYTIKDSLFVKLFNLIFGIVVGLTFYMLGY
ncbi:MAG: putative manganese transporter [Candidatus Caldatribacteriota bacterium]|nr:putative manganese transporter [Candidatus Caldatribacteriota bacterium]